MSYKIYDFADMRFSKKYLKSLPKHHLGFLVASGLAANDISVLTKILIGYSYRATDDRDLLSILSINHWVIRRIISAKTIEFANLFTAYIKQINRKGDDEDIDFAKMLKCKIELIVDSSDFKFAKEIRNAATNHYTMADYTSHFQKYKDKHKFQILMSGQTGNSYFPIAEEIAHLNYFDPDPEKGLDINATQLWLHDTAGDLLKLQHKTFGYIFKKYPNDRARMKTVYVKNKLCIKPGEYLPILFFNGERSRI